MSDDIDVGTIKKPVRKPLPRGASEPEKAQVSESVDNSELNEKLDNVIDLLKAIDWKIWVYLKANNFID